MTHGKYRGLKVYLIGGFKPSIDSALVIRICPVKATSHKSNMQYKAKPSQLNLRYLSELAGLVAQRITNFGSNIVIMIDFIQQLMSYSPSQPRVCVSQTNLLYCSRSYVVLSRGILANRNIKSLLPLPSSFALISIYENQ